MERQRTTQPTGTSNTPPPERREELTDPEAVSQTQQAYASRLPETTQPSPPEIKTGLCHLVIVCCHGIWRKPDNWSSMNEDELVDEKNWLIQPFQRGETGTFVKHMKAGIEILKRDERSLLVLSGGETRREERRSEALSYYECIMGIYGGGKMPDRTVGRIEVEDKALDSYQNILFSLLTFWKTAGRWPEKITIVSHAFKKDRFLQLHLRALRWRREVQYLGIDPEYMCDGEGFDEERTREVREGEEKRGFWPWARDMYGVGEFLVGKRKARDPWKSEDHLLEDGPFPLWREGMGEEVKKLLRWHGDSLFEDPLPWNKLSRS